jgi:putative transposase
MLASLRSDGWTASPELVDDFTGICRRNEPPEEECPIPGELRYPARRWVVERTLGWICKRRSLRIRWCKKHENWLALVQLACAHILLVLAIFG